MSQANEEVGRIAAGVAEKIANAVEIAVKAIVEEATMKERKRCIGRLESEVGSSGGWSWEDVLREQ